MDDSRIDKELQSLREQYHNLVNTSSLGDEQALEKAEKCRELIFPIQERIEYAENRRNQIAAIALGLLAASVALFLSSIVEQLRSQEWILLVRVAALTLFLTSISVLVLYARQINYAYPFVKITKTWRWFYHYSVSEDYKPPFSTIETEQRRKEQQKLHLSDMKSYAEKTINMTPKEELEQDLEQLFLVIVNEKYKNSHLSHLRSVLSYGMLTTITVLIITGILLVLN